MTGFSEFFAAALAGVLTAFALPSVGLAAVFMWCTLSATLLPLGSEPVVFAYIKLNPEQFALCIAVATAGNTLGGMVNYGLAYSAKTRLMPSAPTPRLLAWFARLGPKALLFSFLPVVGDPLTAMAGWLQLPWLPCLLWQALGKALRYIAATALLLWIPDAWWLGVWAQFVGLF